MYPYQVFRGATPIFAPGHKNGNAVSQLLEVVETWFYAQTNRNGHVYIRLVKVFKPPNAYFFNKIEKNIFWPMRIV